MTLGTYDKNPTYVTNSGKVSHMPAIWCHPSTVAFRPQYSGYPFAVKADDSFYLHTRNNYQYYVKDINIRMFKISANSIFN